MTGKEAHPKDDPMAGATGSRTQEAKHPGRSAGTRLGPFLAGVLRRLADLCPEGRTLVAAFVGAVFLAGGYHFLRWPVTGLADTDLWYHLNGGRYLFAHGEIPHSGFFSFIGRDREWFNYYWLFQALAFLVYKAGGYLGLIFLRTGIFAATTGLIAVFFLRAQKSDTARLYFAALWLLCLCVLIPRHFAMVRPHLFSYLFIVLFLVLLEARSQAVLLLPVAAVLWANLHGTEYPVVLLICLAYLVEALWRAHRQGGVSVREERAKIAALILSALGALATPFGPGLLTSPFLFAEYQHLYIVELARPAWQDFLRFQLFPLDGSFDSLSNLLLLAAVFGLLSGAARRKVRVSHFVLAAGGFYLLFGAYRFRYEALLLVLPVLRAHPLLPAVFADRPLERRQAAAGILALAVFALLFFQTVFANRPHYPFSSARLPEGVAAFLSREGPGGTVLNVPSHGGYLQWCLGERYAIFMDLETIVFTDTDYFLAVSAFRDPAALRGFIDTFRPGFIAPLRNDRRFRELIGAHPRYRPVFFDDTAVLYADAVQYPELAGRLALHALDPFTIEEQDVQKLSEEEIRVWLQELEGMQEVYPHAGVVRDSLARIFQRLGRSEEALDQARAVVEYFPESPLGYTLAGDLMLLGEAYEEAGRQYELALARATIEAQPDILRRLSWCMAARGRYEDAYASLRAAVDIFSPVTPAADYERLAELALALGKGGDYAMLREMAAIRRGGDKRHETKGTR